MTGRIEGRLTKVGREMKSRGILAGIHRVLSFPAVFLEDWDQGQVWWLSLVTPASPGGRGKRNKSKRLAWARELEFVSHRPLNTNPGTQ